MQQNDTLKESLNSSPNPLIYFMKISTYLEKSVAGGKEINFRATVHEFHDKFYVFEIHGWLNYICHVTSTLFPGVEFIYDSLRY